MYDIIKTPEEIEKIKSAVDTAWIGYQAFATHVSAGMTEIEVRDYVETYMDLAGADGNYGFPTIVGGGYNSCDLHHMPSNYVLQEGDAVVFDYGPEHDGYTSDITRTFFIGEPSEKAKEIYNIVLEANKLAIEAARPGMTATELDKIARDYIKDAGYGYHFVHALGHGFGTNVHERPTIGYGDRTILKAGMTITIEPGIYVNSLDVGVRIEDDILITEDGCEVLSAHIPKELEDAILHN